MKKLFVMIATLGLGAAAYAGDMNKPTSFDELDVDKDGRLTQQEASKDAKLSKNFQVADVNRDGYVSAAEYQASKADDEREDAE